MSNTSPLPTYGYFHIQVSAYDGNRFMHSNNERAFVISQLQDLLGVRSLLEDPQSSQRMSAQIDLLGYSITAESIQLLAFCISRVSARALATTVRKRLLQYQGEVSPFNRRDANVISVHRLRGPHQALGLSIALHCRHTEWEYDRYSSISFYIHDRRGDWMRIWRLSRLFENDPEIYKLLMFGELEAKAIAARPAGQSIDS